MRDDLPFEEQRVLTTIFTRIAEALYKYEIGESCSLFEHERALNKILDVLTK
jgi:hypothetical protein